MCPIGTKYEFPASDFKSLLDQVRAKSVPEQYNSEGDKIDLTATFVFLLWLGLSVVIVVVIYFMNTTCKEKSLWLFREMDLLPITGGTRKRYVGGIITIFYFMFVSTIIFGFVSHWLFYNHKLETSEMTNLEHKTELPESFKVDVTLYTSKLIEKHNATSHVFKEEEVGQEDICN